MKYTALIVTFNRLGKLKKTVEETLKLEFTNIVIVNNGSTDGTQAWLSSIVDTRVIVLTLTENTDSRAVADGLHRGAVHPRIIRIAGQPV